MKYVFGIVITSCLISLSSVSAKDVKMAQYKEEDKVVLELAQKKAKEANKNEKLISQNAFQLVESKVLQQLTIDESNLKNARKAVKKSKEMVLSNIPSGEKIKIKEAKVISKEAKEDVKNIKESLRCKYANR